MLRQWVLLVSKHQFFECRVQVVWFSEPVAGCRVIDFTVTYLTFIICSVEKEIKKKDKISEQICFNNIYPILSNLLL